ncbi:glycosyltransferase family 2 protein [Vibrio cyclitrophicus]
MSDLVSIIMPCYNSELYIRKSIESVISQTYSNFELIICDDGSTDLSLDIIEEYSQDDRVKIVSNQLGKGAAAARNSCLKSANGRFICFLDSDDIWLPEKISNQVAFMKDTRSVFTYGDYFIFKDDDYINPSSPVFNAPELINFNDLLKTCSIGCLTVMIDTKFIKSFCFPNLPKEDYAAWLRILKAYNIKAKKYPGVCAAYRLSSNTLSSNKFNEVWKQYIVLKIIGELKGFSLYQNLCSYIFRGLIKKFITYKK